MLTPKGYATIQQIENYLLDTIRADFQPQVLEWIAMMEKYIENYTGRVFIADDTASIRKYETKDRPTNTIGNYLAEAQSLYIDECVSIDELTIDGEVIDTGDYITYPANKLPITRIKLLDDSGLFFTQGEQNIEVEASWGYSVLCPDDISFATSILVAGIINYSGDMEGEVKSETIGTYAVTYKDDKDWQDFTRAKQILDYYKKVVI